jgi:hypothetical protein
VGVSEAERFVKLAHSTSSRSDVAATHLHFRRHTHKTITTRLTDFHPNLLASDPALDNLLPSSLLTPTLVLTIQSSDSLDLCNPFGRYLVLLHTAAIAT